MPINSIPPPPRNTRTGRLRSNNNSLDILWQEAAIRNSQRLEERRREAIVEQETQERNRINHAWVDTVFTSDTTEAQNIWEPLTYYYGVNPTRQAEIAGLITPYVVRAIMDRPEGTICGICTGPNTYADDMGWFYVEHNGQQAIACQGCWLDRREPSEPRVPNVSYDSETRPYGSGR